MQPSQRQFPQDTGRRLSAAQVPPQQGSAFQNSSREQAGTWQRWAPSLLAPPGLSLATVGAEALPKLLFSCCRGTSDCSKTYMLKGLYHA